MAGERGGFDSPDNIPGEHEALKSVELPGNLAAPNIEEQAKLQKAVDAAAENQAHDLAAARAKLENLGGEAASVTESDQPKAEATDESQPSAGGASMREKAKQIWDRFTEGQDVRRAEKQRHNEVISLAEIARHADERLYAEEVRQAREAFQAEEAQRQEAQRTLEIQRLSESELTRIANDADQRSQRESDLKARRKELVLRREELSRNAQDVMQALEKPEVGVTGMYNYAPELHEQIRDELIADDIIDIEPIAKIEDTHELKYREGRPVRNTLARVGSKDIYSMSPVELYVYRVKDDPTKAYVMRYDFNDVGEFEATGTVIVNLKEPAFVIDSKAKKKHPNMPDELKVSNDLLDAIEDNGMPTASVSADIEEELPDDGQYRIGPAPDLRNNWSDWNKQSMDNLAMTERGRYERDHPGAKERRERKEKEAAGTTELSAMKGASIPAKARDDTPRPAMSDVPAASPDLAPDENKLEDTPPINPQSAVFRLGQEVAVPTESGLDMGWKVRQLNKPDASGKREVEVYRLDKNGILQTRKLSNWQLAGVQPGETAAGYSAAMQGADNKEYSIRADEGGERTALSKYIDGIRREQSRAGEPVFDLNLKGDITQEQIDELQLQKHKHTPEDLKNIDEEIFARRVKEHSAAAERDAKKPTDFSNFVERVRKDRIAAGDYAFDVEKEGDLTATQIGQLTEKATPEELKLLRDELYHRAAQKEYSIRVGEGRSDFSKLVDRVNREKLDAGEYDFAVPQSGLLPVNVMGKLAEHASPEELEELRAEAKHRARQIEYSAKKQERGKRSAFSTLVDKYLAEQIINGDHSLGTLPGREDRPGGELLDKHIRMIEKSASADEMKELLDEIAFRSEQKEYSSWGRDRDGKRSAFSRVVDKAAQERRKVGELRFEVSRAGQLSPHQLKRLVEKADAEDLETIRKEVEFRDEQQLKDSKIFGAAPTNERRELEVVLRAREEALKLERERAEAKAKSEQAEKEKKEAEKQAEEAKKAAVKNKVPASKADKVDKVRPTVEAAETAKGLAVPESAASAEPERDTEQDMRTAQTLLARINRQHGRELAGHKVHSAMNRLFETAEAKGLVKLSASAKPYGVLTTGTEASDAFIAGLPPMLERKDASASATSPKKAEKSPQQEIDPGSPTGKLSEQITTLAAQSQVEASDIDDLADKAEEEGLIGPGFSRSGAPEGEVIYNQLAALYLKDTEQLDQMTDILNRIEKLRADNRLSETDRNARLARAFNQAVQAGLAKPSGRGIDGKGTFGVTAPDKQSEATRAFIKGLEEMAGIRQDKSHS